MALSNSFRHSLVSFLVGVAICSPDLNAGLVAYRSIPDLVAGADVVVLAQLISVEPSLGTQRGQLVLIADELIKGELPKGPVVVSYQGIGLGRGQVLVGKRVLVFAKRTPESNELSLLPAADGLETVLDDQLFAASSLVAPPDLEKRSEDTPLQRVIKEIFNTQLTSNSTATLAYLLPLAWSRLEPELVGAGFRAMRQSATAGGRINGTTGLVALGDAEGLESLDAELQGNPQLQRLLPDVERFYRSTSPPGLEILSRWLRSGETPTKRQVAAGALANIHTASAIMSLGPVLEDPDFDIRWRVIGGLSMFANNVPIRGAAPAPGNWQFRTDNTAHFSVFDRALVQKDEQRYLQFWRGWWAENQAAVSKLASEQGR